MERYLPRMKWTMVWPRYKDRAVKNEGWQGRYTRTTPEGSWVHRNAPGVLRGSWRQKLEMSFKASLATTETPLLWHSQHPKNTKDTKGCHRVLTLNRDAWRWGLMLNRSNKAIRTAAIFFQDAISSVQLYVLPTQHSFCGIFLGSNFYKLRYGMISVLFFQFLMFMVYIWLQIQLQWEQETKAMLCIMVPVTIVALGQASCLCMFVSF